MGLSSLKLAAIGAVSLAAITSAKAGVIVGSWDYSVNPGIANNWQSVWEGTPSDVSPSTDPVTGITSIPRLGVTTVAGVTSNTPDSVDFSGGIDSDPSIDIIQKIKNQSGTTWTSFAIDLVPDANSAVSNVVGTNLPYLGNPMFSNATAVGNHVTFDGGSIPNGATILLEVTFDIAVPDYPGGFAYSVINTPTAVPEPAALSVMGLATVGLLARRRR